MKQVQQEKEDKDNGFVRKTSCSVCYDKKFPVFCIFTF